MRAVPLALSLWSGRLLAVDFSTTYYCETNSPAGAVATHGTAVSFSFNHGPPATLSNPSALDTILSAADSSEIDQLACMERFFSDVRQRVQTECKAAHPDNATESADCLSEGNLVTAAMQTRMAEIATRAETRGTRPPELAVSEDTVSPPSHVRAGLVSDVGRNCSVPDHPYFRSMPRLLDERDGEFLSVFASASEDCQQRILSDLAENMASHVPDAAYCATSTGAATCRNLSSRITRVLSALRDRTAAGSSLRRSLADDSLSCFVSNNFAELSSLGRSIRSGTACAPLAPGDSRVVDTADPGTSVGAHYRLRRTPDTGGRPRYEIDLGITFQNHGLAPADAENLQARMTERAQQCMDDAGDAFRGPNGEALHIRINPSDLPSGLARRVDVTNSTPRENSALWERTIDCQTAIHEMMHLLGLPDEYCEPTRLSGTFAFPSVGISPERVATEAGLASAGVHATTETADPATTSYDCRAVGPPNSLMRNQWDAMRPTMPRTQVTECRCRNPEEVRRREGTAPRRAAEACMRQMRRVLASLSSATSPADLHCPEGATNSVATVESRIAPRPDDGALVMLGSETYVQSFDEFSYNLYEPAPSTNPAVLYPAQFRALLYPECESANHRYYTCTRASRSTGRARGGRGCPDLPSYCRTPEEWMR